MDDSTSFAGRLEQLKQAYVEVDAAIRANHNRYAAFGQAGELEELTDVLNRAAAVLRGVVARNIAQDESLALAGLAERLSMSKTRAAQLIRKGITDGGDDGQAGDSPAGL